MPYRGSLASSAFADVVKNKARRFLQVYNRDVSFCENGYINEERVAGRTLFHVSKFMGK